jgi:hypothetical protein
LQRSRVRISALVAGASLLCVASAARAYTQDTSLEAALRRGDRAALALLPAKGYRDGAAGFFTAHDLHVVAGSERAWCTQHRHGALGPGCYIEFVFQGKGLRRATWNGEPCGCIGRWHKAPGAKAYVPTEGAYFSRAIAEDRAFIVERAIYEDVRPACR